MCYETNLTDARWQIIAEFIEDERKRKYSLRNIVDAVLYLVKTGCQWRYLPKDFPNWQLVYYYFRKFETTGLIEIIHDTLRERVRVKKGKEVSPSLGLVDSQSVKTASVSEEKGLDGNKKVSGRKRFIVTDTLGLMMGILIVAANVGERAGAEKLFNETKGKYPRLKKVLADQGFDGEKYVARIQLLFGFVFEIVNKVLGVGGFQVQPKRWIVERAFGWLVWNRRLVKDYEEKTEVSKAFIQLAMIRLMLKQLASRKFKQTLMKKYDKAIEALKKVISLAPESAEPHLTLGAIYWDAKKKTEYLQEYNILLNLNPKYAQQLKAATDTDKKK